MRTLLLLLMLLLLQACSLKNYALFQDENLSEEPTVYDDKAYEGELKFVSIIQPNDRLDVTVFNQAASGEQQLTSLTQSRGASDGATPFQGFLVTPEGTIRLPLIGIVKVAGMTELEAAGFLITKYKRYLRNPYVVVQLLNSRAYIIGEINQQGVVPITNGTISLIEVLALSGGLTDFSDRTQIKILSGDLRHPHVRIVDLTQMQHVSMASLIVKPNDVVYIQPNSLKAWNLTIQTIAPPFQLVSTILQPFVQLQVLANTANGR